jgi:hypothetical protein
MKTPKNYIIFKIETAENMDKGKVILLTHPDNKEMLSMLLSKLKNKLDKLEWED